MHEQSENINKEKETMQKQPNRNNRVENVTEILKGFKSRYDQAEDRLRKLEYQSCRNHQVKREKKNLKK